MDKRYNFTLYAIVFFVSFLMVFLFPGSFMAEGDDKSFVVTFSIVVMCITGTFLTYKIIKWVKAPDEENE